METELFRWTHYLRFYKILSPYRQSLNTFSDAAAPLYLYHSCDDETVPFSHVGMFAKALPHATVRRFEGHNHQLNDNLSELAHDIRGLR